MTTNLYMFAAKASEIISKKVGQESSSSFSITKTLKLKGKKVGG
jgi:hypothetical protein